MGNIVEYIADYLSQVDYDAMEKEIHNIAETLADKIYEAIDIDIAEKDEWDDLVNRLEEFVEGRYEEAVKLVDEWNEDYHEARKEYPGGE